MSDKKPDERKPYIRPSERMFRRSRAAEMRRRESQAKEAKFMRFVFGIAGFAALIAFLFFYMFANMAQAAENTSGEDENMQNGTLTQPILGNFSIIDIAGIAFVAVAGYAVWRKYSGPKK